MDRMSPGKSQISASFTVFFATGWLFNKNEIFDKINID